MISRSHQKADAASVAVYSDCEAYRYLLTRVWEPEGRKALFVMLNPSTATEVQNDPTVERCERRARALGVRGISGGEHLCLSRDRSARDANRRLTLSGRQNDAAILESIGWADQIICAWGGHGAHLGRGAEVRHLLSGTRTPLFHLGLTKDGQPKHPLYIAYTEAPRAWT